MIHVTPLPDRARHRPVTTALAAALTAACVVLALPRLASGAPAPKAAAASFEEASALYRAEDWARAAKAFESVVAREPENGPAWYRLGVSYRKIHANEKAIAAYRRAESIGHGPAVMFQLACALSASGKPDSALAWLGRAVDAGYRQSESLEKEPDLTAIRGDARFADVMDRVRRIETPCAFTPEARQFDFWVGAWDVRNAQGDLAGTNDIRLGAGGCALIESWKSTQGGTGQSLNFYDGDAKLWRQIWVDADAGVTRFQGAFAEGQMRFTGERVEKDGRRVSVKMTFTPLSDGRIRQTGEAARDGGTTWTVEYDLYYTPARRDG